MVLCPHYIDVLYIILIFTLSLMTYTTASLPLSYDISSREINSCLSCIHLVFDSIGIGSPAKCKNCSWPWMFCTQLISCIFQMMGTAHCNVQKSGAPVLFVLLIFLIWLVDVQGEERYANLASGTVHYPDSKCTHHPIHCCLLCCVSAAIVLQMRYVLHFSIEQRVASYSFMMCTGIYVGCGRLDDVCIIWP
jgi:hypothetical protein